MVKSWSVILSRHTVKDAKKIKQAGLKSQAELLLQLIQSNPFNTPPPYEKLCGNLDGYYSRRINIQHRLVYSVDKAQRVVHILRMWSHYE